MDSESELAISDGLSLDQQVCFALYSCANRVTRLYRLVLQPIGITFTQYLVMLALWEKDPQNISELAQVLVIEPNTVTPMIKRMELLGLVSRSRHSFDERQVQVTVTQKGLDLRADAIAIRRNLVERLGMPEDELAEIREVVKHFADRVTIATA